MAIVHINPHGIPYCGDCGMPLPAVSGKTAPSECPDCKSPLDYSKVLAPEGPGEYVEYSLHIRGGDHGDYFEHFETLSELQDAISYHLTKREIAAGVINRLCNFPKVRLQDGFVQNNWRNFSVCAYQD